MKVDHSLLINGVMITPAEIHTARISKPFVELERFPFVVMCDMAEKKFGMDSNPRLVAVPVRSEEEGQDVIRQIFEIRGQQVKIQLQESDLVSLLKKALEKFEALQK